MKILVVDKFAKVISVECESTDTIAHLKIKLDEGISNLMFDYNCGQRNLMFDGKLLGDNLSENMTLAEVGVQDGSLILQLYSYPSLSSEVYLSSTMKILVMDKMTAKVSTSECESTDTIAHLKAKLNRITKDLMFDGKRLGDKFSENMMLADVGIKDGSLILDSSLPRGYFTITEFFGIPERPKRRPENDYLYYADAFKSGWRDEHTKALLHLLLELCQDGTISDGNVTDEAWLKIQNSLKTSIKCSFQIDFLKECLCDYKQLYSVLTETSSPFFEWDRERKTVTINNFNNCREEYPELLLLCGPHIPYFDTLEELCLLMNTTRSSKKSVFKISTNINNAREASSSREEIFMQLPSDSNLSPMGSSTLIGKENGYLSSTMKILVVDESAKVFSVVCESTDTIAHLKQKLDTITYDLMIFDGKKLGDEFSENMTLAEVGVQHGSLILLGAARLYMEFSASIIERPRRVPENDYLHYADAFKSGWREEHAKALLHLLLELSQDGTISEGNVTDEAWLRIQNSLKNSMNCSFQMDFLKERLHDYKQLYSVLTETTSSSILKWDRERKTIMEDNYSEDVDWRKEYPELLLLCGRYISYFDTLEEVCLLLNTRRSSEERVPESSTSINNAWEASSSRLSKLRSMFCVCQRS